jgi:glycosyltransferase involved in cell wall biosynthesis
VPALAFVVPGPLGQVTGGYLFDRRVVEGLRSLGWRVGVAELPGAVFPTADAAALDAADALLAGLPDDAAVAFDGIALPAFARSLPAAAGRLRLLGFVHHPLAVETGLSAQDAAFLADLERSTLPRLRGVLCPSERTAQAVIAYGVPPALVAVTPPGTPKPSAPRPPRSDRGPLRLLCVATLTPRKGHLVLIEALARLAGRAWRLTCIGSLTRDPETTDAVRAAIARHGLEDRVALAGEWAPKTIARAYADADLFVLPSYHEGYGMAYAEALAFGLPIVATRAGAIPDTVPAAAGLLVAPGDAAALAGALGRIMDDPALRARLAGGAAAAGEALPDWDAAIGVWASAAQRLLAAPSIPR